jgi:hypothetical protein
MIKVFGVVKAIVVTGVNGIAVMIIAAMCPAAWIPGASYVVARGPDVVDAWAGGDIFIGVNRSYGSDAYAYNDLGLCGGGSRCDDSGKGKSTKNAFHKSSFRSVTEQLSVGLEPFIRLSFLLFRIALT